MKPAMFREMTSVLGAPNDWDAEKHGECGGLPIAFDPSSGAMTSCWVLEPEDIAALAAGGRVYLTVFANRHPVVAMAVKVDP